jgi:hypothetical protein
MERDGERGLDLERRGVWWRVACGEKRGARSEEGGGRREEAREDRQQPAASSQQQNTATSYLAAYTRTRAVSDSDGCHGLRTPFIKAKIPPSQFCDGRFCIRSQDSYLIPSSSIYI